MRTIEWTSQFKRDYKREGRGRYRSTLDDDLFSVVDYLAKDLALKPHYRDHALTGAWKDHRDCHIKPNLVLIYQLPDESSIRLVRLGSNSELGL